ncbi:MULTISPECIES: IclR family transcriptional regulator domain-containing protein [Pseudomonas]|uniref:IclR family transcriptional regulator domain-containing protein n=1 Tax=Pseudomonas TaxID=286 RepID=UPI0029401CD8|nr:IclR family transcriptional regulator C-terminal domain-containing protein [Pseudomonas sp. LSJ-87]MDV5097257.1 IclR family transcriptional regulator C-terminal domain-containing protein [Pseudomonas sp. LSJ-87]
MGEICSKKGQNALLQLAVPNGGKFVKTGEGTAALEKALDVLQAIGASASGISQAQLAEQVPLPRTTLYRIIATLVDRGMIRRDPTRKVYRLGFNYLEMVRNAYLEPDLVSAASEELRALRDLTGETSYLAVLDGNQVLSLERCDGAHTQRSAASLGQAKPVYCTGQGKAILSALSPTARDEILKGLVLTPLTPLTITDRRRLLAELQITQARGYALDDEEIRLGVRCVAAPIIDKQGHVRGALSVAGPAYRLTLERLNLLGPELAEAARRVGEQLRPDHVPQAATELGVVPGPWAFHGAFPRWHAEQKRLYWADTLAPAIHCWDGHVSRQVARLDLPIRGMELHPDGLLVAQTGGWSLVDWKGQEHPRQDLMGSRLLALASHPSGALWACAKAANGCLIGELSAEGELRHGWAVPELVSAFSWDASGRSVYALASASGNILMLNTGSSHVRRLASLPRGGGRLGGLTIDSAGGVWTTQLDGWSLAHFDADGNLDRMVGLPVPTPTDLCIGGVDGKTLYITSARHSLQLEALASAPDAGCLLQMQL